MSSHSIDSGPVNRAQINMNEPFEVRYWSKQFDISVSQLKAVVAKVGPDTEAIRHALAAAGNKAWQL